MIVELAGFWEQLDIDPNDFVVAGGLTRPRLGNSFLVSPSVFNIISNVAGPKESLDPSKTIAETVSAAVTPIDTMGGAIGPELAYAASNQAIMTRMVTVINSENTGSADNAIAARIKTMALAGAENASSMSFPGAHGSWFSAVSVSRDATPLGLFNAGLPASVSAVQSAIDTQQTKMAVLAEMKAQNRGGTTVVAGEAANDINHVQENTDTQNFVSGALKRQYDTIKTVLLKTITTISGTAKTLSDGQVVDALKQGVSGGSDFFNFSKNLVKEITNALASTTLSKVSGVKFEQQTEGRVQQAKFMLNQAGSSLSNEAPVIRNSARLNVVQAEMLVSESHASGYKSVWEHHIVDKAAGFATTDFYVNAKGKLTQTANKANYYGQAGTEIADKDHVTIDVGQGKAQVHATNTGITIQLGSASISLGTGGIININPLSAPSPVNVDIKFTQPQSFEAQPDNAASVLPAKGNRNPIPCASPYNDLNTVLPDLEK